MSHPHAICSAPLTHGAARSKFCGRTHPGKSMGFRASQHHCEFGNGFKRQLGVKLSACDARVMTGAPSADPHRSGGLRVLCTEHPLTLYMSGSPPVVGLGMPKGIRLDDTAHCMPPSPLYFSLCRPILTIIRCKLLRKHNKNLTI